MSLPMILTGVNGALGLYSTVKGAIDSYNASKEKKNLLKNAKDEENSWYRKNYFGSFLDDSATKAAIKRVENTLRRNNEGERARSAIMGTTPEYSLARNEQGLRSMENVLTNIASMDSSKKRDIETLHRNNLANLTNIEYNDLSMDERMARSSATSGYNLFQNALLGATWGKER
ncbi:MAG: hypothetical protein J6U58_05485 [Bacteroidaceae bacterium]|nr:hypothetical protein [Bacteroidaceae bacterium]